MSVFYWSLTYRLVRSFSRGVEDHLPNIEISKHLSCGSYFEGESGDSSVPEVFL